ncbi:MAG: substrate-binding periplasmic protein [Burkholderiales bacterium]
MIRVLAVMLLWVAASSFLSEAQAQQVFELQPEYVYGKNRKPKMGYRKPEVFDPLSDEFYQSGYRDFPAIPDELKEVDAMTRTQKLGRILVCADGWFWPFSRTARKHEPPGIDIEIMQAIARKNNWDIGIMWANTGTRFGQGPAFHATIDRGVCDVFVGLTITGEDQHLSRHTMLFSNPYMSSGFVLVTQGPAKDVKTLDDVKARGIKIGVPVYSPIYRYVQANGFQYEGFYQSHMVIEALLKGEVNAAMIWAGAVSRAKLEHPEAEFEMVKGYMPMSEMRWNSAWGVKEKEVELMQFINAALGEMHKKGEIRRIVERYGMPYLPPF